MRMRACVAVRSGSVRDAPARCLPLVCKLFVTAARMTCSRCREKHSKGNRARRFSWFGGRSMRGLASRPGYRLPMGNVQRDSRRCQRARHFDRSGREMQALGRRRRSPRRDVVNVPAQAAFHSMPVRLTVAAIAAETAIATRKALNARDRVIRARCSTHARHRDASSLSRDVLPSGPRAASLTGCATPKTTRPATPRSA